MERMQYEVPTLVYVEVKQSRVFCTSEVRSSAKINLNVGFPMACLSMVKQILDIIAQPVFLSAS